MTMTYEEAKATLAAYEEAKAAAVAAAKAASDAANAAAYAAYDAYAAAVAAAKAMAKLEADLDEYYAAESQPKGIIWDSEPETRCDCGNVCTNCGGPGHM